MDNKNNITVFSSFALDRLLDKKGRLLNEQKGGPAFYIELALKKEQIAFNLLCYPTLEVEILIDPIKGEYGRITSRVKPKKINWRLYDSSTILVSTLLNEFDINTIKECKQQVFLDVQGYVRDGKNFGKKKFWDFNADTLFCVKGTEEEISYLPKNFIEKQKQKMLLMTLGSNGSILYFKNKAISTKPEMVIRSTDTIGAGDSFFAYFITKYLQSNNPALSLEYATSKTTSFLSSKTHHTNPF